MKDEDRVLNQQPTAVIEELVQGQCSSFNMLVAAIRYVQELSDVRDICC